MLAAAAAAVPFGFGIIRAIATGNDVRYILVALAALVGAALVVMVWKTRAPTLRSTLTVAAAVFVTSTLAAVLAARLLGTVIGPGMLVVASSFGLCFAFAAALHTIAGSDFRR